MICCCYSRRLRRPETLDYDVASFIVLRIGREVGGISQAEIYTQTNNRNSKGVSIVKQLDEIKYHVESWQKKDGPESDDPHPRFGLRARGQETLPTGRSSRLAPQPPGSIRDRSAIVR